MKVVLALVGVLLAITVSGLAEARSWIEVKSSRVLRVAVDGSTPGFNYFEGKNLAGFEIDLIQEMAKSLGLRIEWVVQPFNTLLVAINQDRFDLIATSFAKTPARAAVIDFTDPHYCTGAVIVSRAQGPKSRTDLKDKTVVVPVGTVYLDHLKKVPGIKEIRTVPDETSGLQNLLTGRADAWVTEQFVAIKAVEAHQKEGISLGAILEVQENAMVVAKGNQELLAKINGALKKTLNNGFYSKLTQRYFKRDIRCR